VAGRLPKIQQQRSWLLSNETLLFDSHHDLDPIDGNHELPRDQNVLILFWEMIVGHSLRTCSSIIQKRRVLVVWVPLSLHEEEEVGSEGGGTVDENTCIIQWRGLLFESENTGNLSLDK